MMVLFAPLVWLLILQCRLSYGEKEFKSLEIPNIVLNLLGKDCHRNKNCQEPRESLVKVGLQSSGLLNTDTDDLSYTYTSMINENSPISTFKFTHHLSQMSVPLQNPLKSSLPSTSVLSSISQITPTLATSVVDALSTDPTTSLSRLTFNQNTVLQTLSPSNMINPTITLPIPSTLKTLTPSLRTSSVFALSSLSSLSPTPVLSSITLPGPASVGVSNSWNNVAPVNFEEQHNMVDNFDSIAEDEIKSELKRHSVSRRTTSRIISAINSKIKTPKENDEKRKNTPTSSGVGCSNVNYITVNVPYEETEQLGEQLTKIISQKNNRLLEQIITLKEKVDDLQESLDKIIKLNSEDQLSLSDNQLQVSSGPSKKVIVPSISKSSDVSISNKPNPSASNSRRPIKRMRKVRIPSKLTNLRRSSMRTKQKTSRVPSIREESEDPTSAVTTVNNLSHTSTPILSPSYVHTNSHAKPTSTLTSPSKPIRTHALRPYTSSQIRKKFSEKIQVTPVNSIDQKTLIDPAVDFSLHTNSQPSTGKISRGNAKDVDSLGESSESPPEPEEEVNSTPPKSNLNRSNSASKPRRKPIIFRRRMVPRRNKPVKAIEISSNSQEKSKITPKIEDSNDKSNKEVVKETKEKTVLPTAEDDSLDEGNKDKNGRPLNKLTLPETPSITSHSTRPRKRRILSKGRRKPNIRSNPQRATSPKISSGNQRPLLLEINLNNAKIDQNNTNEIETEAPPSFKQPSHTFSSQNRSNKPPLLKPPVTSSPSLRANAQFAKIPRLEETKSNVIEDSMKDNSISHNNLTSSEIYEQVKEKKTLQEEHTNPPEINIHVREIQSTSRNRFRQNRVPHTKRPSSSLRLRSKYHRRHRTPIESSTTTATVIAPPIPDKSSQEKPGQVDIVKTGNLTTASMEVKDAKMEIDGNIKSKPSGFDDSKSPVYEVNISADVTPSKNLGKINKTEVSLPENNGTRLSSHNSRYGLKNRPRMRSGRRPVYNKRKSG